MCGAAPAYQSRQVTGRHRQHLPEGAQRAHDASAGKLPEVSSQSLYSQLLLKLVSVTSSDSEVPIRNNWRVTLQGTKGLLRPASFPLQRPACLTYTASTGRL